MNKKISQLAVAALFSLAAVTASAATFTLLSAQAGASSDSSPAMFDAGGNYIIGGSQSSSIFSRGTAWSITSPNSPIDFKSLGDTNKHGSLASINASGIAVGNSRNNDGAGVQRATMWSFTNPNSSTELQSLGNSSKVGAAKGINDSGQIVGQSYNAGSIGKATLWSGVSNTPSELFSLGGGTKSGSAQSINNSGLIVGNSQDGNSVNKATLWSTAGASGTLLESLGAGTKTGNAAMIDSSGNIVGSSQDVNGVSKATSWFAANVTTVTGPTLLESLGGSSKTGYAQGINALGQVLGSSQDANGVSKATLWTNGVATDLNDLLSASDKMAGWILTSAIATNADGSSIIGRATNSLLGINSKGFLLQSVAAVPEADTSAMLLLGAGLMGFIAHRRRNTQA
ncbi:MAG: PEP-CTERM sorting domain-containing protein [Burkholderiaceae bacterium]|nr:PEP-CTERM sorting domain-containing protein [Burkholderiaceae bacterium]